MKDPPNQLHKQRFLCDYFFLLSGLAYLVENCERLFRQKNLAKQPQKMKTSNLFYKTLVVCLAIT